ncbi:MAG: hypothetical protein AB7H92_16860 [Microbacteriaceae bacterium]
MTVNLAATLAGNFDVGWALAAGVLGGLAFLVVVTMGFAIGMTRMNFLQVLGTMLAPKASRPTVYATGLAAHLMASAGFGLVHAGLLHAIGITSVGEAAGWDLVLGMAHGVVILAMLPAMLTAMHPLVRNGAMDRPGVALTGFGTGTPVGSLMAHVAFGLVVGAVYAAAIL